MSLFVWFFDVPIGRYSTSHIENFFFRIFPWGCVTNSLQVKMTFDRGGGGFFLDEEGEKVEE